MNSRDWAPKWFLPGLALDDGGVTLPDDPPTVVSELKTCSLGLAANGESEKYASMFY